MPRLKSILLRLPLVALVSTLVLVLALWLAGRVLSDRWGWSQWLLWLPTPAAVVAAGAGFAQALLRRKGAAARRRLAWGVALAAVLLFFTVVEHRFLPRAAKNGAGGVRLVHWTMSHEKRGRRPAHAERVAALDGDITILVDAQRVQVEPAILDWLGPDATPRQWGRVSILTRLPLRQLRPIVATEQINVLLVTVDTTAALGRPLVIYVVDLPSDPRTPRVEVARRLRRLLDATDAPPPDVVVGDFNMTRGGAALAASFPRLHHAYDEAGTGYAATFHRALPLWHIDHVLLGPAAHARSYEILDPGLGRHGVQVARVEVDEGGR